MNSEKRAEFDQILEKIIASLPDYVREQLREVPVIVEDEPCADILRDLGESESEESDLCGLHTGIPLSDQTPSFSSLVPNVIHIFRGPISRLAGNNQRKLEREIRITLLHEIGHHFGFSEEKLESMGYG
jgi:predicted Zn-dependent protease with MMP-like domain